MATFVPSKNDLRISLLFCYLLKETASEAHEMLVEAYGEHALARTQCFKWFKKFKDGDFNLTNKERERTPRKFEDAELQELLDENDSQPAQQELAERLNVSRSAISRRLKVLGKSQERRKRQASPTTNGRQKRKRKQSNS